MYANHKQTEFCYCCTRKSMQINFKEFYAKSDYFMGMLLTKKFLNILYFFGKSCLKVHNLLTFTWHVYIYIYDSRQLGASGEENGHPPRGGFTDLPFVFS